MCVFPKPAVRKHNRQGPRWVAQAGQPFRNGHSPALLTGDHSLPESARLGLYSWGNSRGQRDTPVRVTVVNQHPARPAALPPCDGDPVAPEWRPGAGILHFTQGWVFGDVPVHQGLLLPALGQATHRAVAASLLGSETRGDPPSSVVQVDDEGLVSELLKSLVVVAVHIPCGEKPGGSEASALLRGASRPPRVQPPEPQPSRTVTSPSLNEWRQAGPLGVLGW